jgi:hypothetical protein
MNETVMLRRQGQRHDVEVKITERKLEDLKWKYQVKQTCTSLEDIDDKWFEETSLLNIRERNVVSGAQ